MHQEDYPTRPSERSNMWSFMTVSMQRKDGRFGDHTHRHGIETPPEIHNYIYDDNVHSLTQYLWENQDIIETVHRMKTPLLASIKHDSYACFNVLLRYGADVEAQNGRNETAIIMATRMDREMMFKELVLRGACIFATDRMCRTITEIIISRDNVDWLRFLHEDRLNLLNYDQQNNEFPLTLAISHQARACTDYILSLDLKVHSFLIGKDSCPIAQAIRRNDLSTITQLSILPYFRTIINRNIHKSISYIHLAVQKRRTKVTHLLLQNGAFVNLLDNHRNTPAHYVEDIPTLRVLIYFGANLTARNSLNQTPLMKAESDGRNAITHFLRNYHKNFAGEWRFLRENTLKELNLPNRKTNIEWIDGKTDDEHRNDNESNGVASILNATITPMRELLLFSGPCDPLSNPTHIMGYLGVTDKQKEFIDPSARLEHF